jgi:aminoglycoside phosphotransferase (APT) family kinase protein
MLPIPRALDEVSPVWLTDAFRSGGAVPDATVIASVAEVTGTERGFTGTVARLHLRWDREEGLPETAILKLPHVTAEEVSAYRAMLHRDPAVARQAMERFAREVRFYHDLAPATPALAPRSYAALTDPATHESAVLLEDLDGSREGDALAGCSVDDAARVLRKLAQFHAHWWGRIDRPDLSWVPVAGGEPTARQHRYAHSAPRFLDRYGTQVPENVRQLLAALVPAFGDVTARAQRTTQTLIHADLHLDNVFFRDDAAGGHVTIIDWQSVSKGMVATDLSQFIVTSLHPEDRVRAERDLIASYHATLQQCGVSGYALDDLLHDYRYGVWRYCGAAVIWLGSVDRTTLSGRELALVDGVVADGRLFAAVQDPDVVRLLPAR